MASIIDRFNATLRDKSGFKDETVFGFELGDLVIKLHAEGESRSALLNALQEYRSMVFSEKLEDLVLDIMDLVYDWEPDSNGH
jgi:hypothetical protein